MRKRRKSQVDGTFIPKKRKVIIVGGVYGHLTVLERLGMAAGTRNPMWRCKCNSCGAEETYTSQYIKTANTDFCRKCVPRKLAICVHGHLLEDWGRSPTRACRGCGKEKSLMRNYGITIAEYKALLEFQNNKCALCGCELSFQKPGAPGWFKGTRIEVDHKHGTNLPKKQTVRGLLCGGRWAGCNRKLGRLDNAAWLRAALAYIENPPAAIFFKNKLPTVPHETKEPVPSSHTGILTGNYGGIIRPVVTLPGPGA